MTRFDLTQTNAAVERLIETTENPRHLYLLHVYNRHRYLEMAGRYHEISAPEMTVAHPVYRFNLFGMNVTPDGREQVGAVYREWTRTAQCVFYTNGDERLAVGDNMICSTATIYQQTPGSRRELIKLRPDQVLMPHESAKLLEPLIKPCPIPRRKSTRHGRVTSARRQEGWRVMNSSDGSDKSLAIVGVLTVVVYLAAFGLTPTGSPNSASPGVQIVHYATVHRDQLLASELLFALGVALLMVFAAGVHRVLRRAEDQSGWLAMASLATVIAGAGIFGAGTALFMTVAYRPATNPAVARALWDAGWLAYNSAGFAFGAWIAIIVVAAFRHHAMPRWTAWIGVPIAVISLAGPLAVKAGIGPFSPQGRFAILVGVIFAVWLLAVSVAAWRPKRTPVNSF